MQIIIQLKKLLNFIIAQKYKYTNTSLQIVKIDEKYKSFWCTKMTTSNFTSVDYLGHS